MNTCENSVNAIAVICVNYNTTDKTIDLCNSIADMIGFNENFIVDVFVVDNSPVSCDRLSNYIDSKHFTNYLRSDSNDGYFAALNYGLSKIDKIRYKYICVGNNDLLFSNDFVKKLCEKKFKENVMVVCPDIVTLDGRHQNPHHINRFNHFSIIPFDIYFSNYIVANTLVFIKKIIKKISVDRSVSKLNSEIEISGGVGAFYVLTRSFFHKNSELYFPSFLYGEEAVLSWQVRQSGGIFWYDPSLIVTHCESATLSQLPSKVTYEYARTSYWKIRRYFLE